MKADEGTQIYVNVDDNGNIISAMQGKMLVVNQQWDFYFYESQEVADNLQDYKVIVEGLRKKLVLK